MDGTRAHLPTDRPATGRLRLRHIARRCHAKAAAARAL
jgi:hypothetical protein